MLIKIFDSIWFMADTIDQLKPTVNGCNIVRKDGSIIETGTKSCDEVAAEINKQLKED